MLPAIQLDSGSEEPLYRQLYARIREMITSGALSHGERLPATRELAGSLGLNRTTVSAAYALLESEALIQGHVGRGSFVLAEPAAPGLNWDQVLGAAEAAPAPASSNAISFSSSRPAEDLFPLEAFRQSCQEALAGKDAATILQLGSPAGYAPLRHYLLDEARREGLARAGDDLMVVNGCQQALDLIERVLVRPGDTVAVEDPVYPGLRNLFAGGTAKLEAVPVGPDGVDLPSFERTLMRARPRLAVLTPSFQNPTGATLRAEARRAVLRLARAAGTVLVENDIYGELRYEGEAVPPIKRLDDGGHTVLLRSFSKVTFPGLRVGWILGPRPLVARLAEAKQLADLHTDQLSQAVLLRFAESGRLAAHRERVVAAGRERLEAVLEACERELPAGTYFTRPQGGMNLWVRLPDPLDAGELLARAQREGVSYLPGRYFEVTRREPGGLRLCFAGLTPEKIRAGLAILGRVFASELARSRRERYEPAPAVVCRLRLMEGVMFLDDTFRVKVGLAEMLKGGVIMDVTNAEQALIAEQAGAAAVMALERVPADIRKEGGVARMAPVQKIREIMQTVSIPVMAKCRIGHFMEARILESLKVDYIDESEVLTPADEEHHVDKRQFTVPFVCGARNLGEALRRIAEGAAMIRTKGEAGSGNIVEAVRHMRTIQKEMKQLTVLGKEELAHAAKELQAPLELVEWVAGHGKLPVPNFSAGGIATPADAALVMQLGAESVFVGSGIFKSSDPDVRARAIVKATTYYNDPAKLLEACEELGAAMFGLDVASMPESERLAMRGW